MRHAVSGGYRFIGTPIREELVLLAAALELLHEEGQLVCGGVRRQA